MSWVCRVPRTGGEVNVVSLAAAIRAAIVAAGVVGVGCSPSPSELVTQLGDPQRDAELVKQELLLARGRAVEPVLGALDSPHPAPQEVADVLVRLTTRMDDARLDSAISRHLRSHPDGKVRARLAHGLGSRPRLALAEALAEALSDTVVAVRLEALVALSGHFSRLEPRTLATLRDAAPRLRADGDARIREEAAILVDRFVDPWITGARQAVLAADVGGAESLLAQALAYDPANYRAQYQLGMLWLQHGRREDGVRQLAAHGMLADAPRVAQAPTVDGRLDEAAWSQAATLGPFYILSHLQTAALPAAQRTEVRVLHTGSALYLGARCFDSDPGQLIVLDYAREADKPSWNEDFVELFFDVDFDRTDYFHASINGAGVYWDQLRRPAAGAVAAAAEDPSWNAPARAAARVGDDSWSVEVELRLAGGGIPPVAPGDLWGFNMGRMYRATDYTEWIRTPTGTHNADQFGVLRFQ